MLQDATSTDLFKAMKEKVPSPLHAIDDKQELSDDSTLLTNQATNLTSFAVMDTKGDSDLRVQFLQSCPNKDVIGVSTPSIRACPFCGALVQHTDACKHMNCPACSRAFCFICLKKNEGGWQCGSYNSKCTPAPRQTYIPG